MEPSMLRFIIIFFTFLLIALSAFQIKESEHEKNIVVTEPHNVLPPTNDPEPVDEVEEETTEEPEEKILEEQVTTPPITITAPPLPIPPPQPISPKPVVTQDEIYQKGLLSTVNFFCSDTEAGTITTATGAIIHEQGLVLTSAHILDNFSEQTPLCVLRRGSPARNFTKAFPVYIPDAYKNGETQSDRIHYDFAIWKIQNPKEMYDSWQLEAGDAPAIGDTYFTLSYPAESAGYETILKNLHLAFSLTTVSNIYPTFIRSEASVSSQSGSSGGIIIDQTTGNIQGLIFGVSEGEETFSKRSLFSIRPSQIRAIIVQETQKTIEEFLQELLDVSYTENS